MRSYLIVFVEINYGSSLEEECKESIVHAHIHLLMGVLDDPNLNKKDAFYLQIEKKLLKYKLL